MSLQKTEISYILKYFSVPKHRKLSLVYSYEIKVSTKLNSLTESSYDLFKNYSLHR